MVLIMKYINPENLDRLSGKRLENSDIFSFHCHFGLKCFNQCCRNLNLFLYPYDVIRLKNRLGITSERFIDKYVDIVLRDNNYFPEVLLCMSENKEKTCPFLTESGCSVYTDRPDACRTFPIEQGILYDAEKKKTESIQFFRPPDFCLGQYENRNWTVKTWIMDQDAVFYNRMTARWAGIKYLFRTDPWRGEGPDGPRGKMAFMATYNLDQFRDFLFNSSFLKRYRVNPLIIDKIKKDDVELLKLSFDWIKFYLWGTKVKTIQLR